MVKTNLPSLNGLRALSILLVLGHHAAWAPNFPAKLQGRWAYIFDGSLGVNIFFVISGFLITWLMIDEENRQGKISLKNFYIRRFLRILPVYYCLLGCYFILQLAGILHMPFVSEWLPALTFTRDFFGTKWETGHLWSLAVEEQFYIFWPFIFKFLSKKARTSVAITLIIAALLLRYLFYFNYSSLLDSHSFFTNLDCIMIGCLVALHAEKILDFISKFNVNITRVALAAVILASLYIRLRFSYDVLPKTFISIAAGLLIISLTSHRFGIGYKFLNLPFINYLGKLSYSLYIWQQIFFSPALKPFSNVPLNYLLIFAVAFISYNFLEKPILKFKVKFAR